jgi:hypothetical protein
MANTVLTASIIAKEATLILENELQMAKCVHRAHEKEFSNQINGYTPGSTVTIKKPTDFTVRSGATASAQDVVEGSTSITVNQQKGIDFKFSSLELTLSIKELSERVIRPAMIQLANQVDLDLFSMYKNVPNWVGTPASALSSFAGLARAAQRMDVTAVPQGDRTSMLSPADYWGLTSAQTALYMQDVAKSAYRQGELGNLAGMNTMMSQNVPTHTTGPGGGTPLINGASQNVLYSAAKDTNTQSLITDGWTAAAAARVVVGDVFTIAGVYDVNPVTKATLPHLKQFVVTANGSSDGSGNLTMTISPAIISSGANQTVSAAPADNAALTFNLGAAASTGFAQNLAFHKNAFALAMVPMVTPPGSVDCSRESFNGISTRVIPYYDGTNDVSNWRLDILYGFKAIDPRLAVRFNG